MRGGPYILVRPGYVIVTHDAVFPRHASYLNSILLTPELPSIYRIDTSLVLQESECRTREMKAFDNVDLFLSS